MSDLADIAERTQRFNEAVRAFTPPSPVHHAKLIPMKDGIMELRQKGASPRLIRELLATVGLAVSTATIMRFLAEVSRNSASARQRQRFAHGRTPVQNTTRGEAAAVLVATVAVTGSSPPTQLLSSNPLTTANAEKASERSRTRGPRIADPRNV